VSQGFSEFWIGLQKKDRGDVVFSILKPKIATEKIPTEHIEQTYKNFRFQSLLGVFLGYMAYYIVRNNFALSTPFLKKSLGLSATEVGLLTSCMLIAYGISKGIMSSLADKCSPKVYMALGLLLCALVNVMLGFSTAFWMFAVLVALNGLFQGMGVGPCFITIANWFPKKERGFIGAVWNISHNVGGGIVAPIVGFGFAMAGPEHWQFASYQVPAAVAIVFAMCILLFTKGSPVSEGLPHLNEIVKEEACPATQQKGSKPPEDMSPWQIFSTYVLKNKNAWYVSILDAFVYMVRFGMVSWMPIYLLNVKHFTKTEMGVAFMFFEWAAIPSTLFVGYITDKFFKGYRMPPAMIAMVMIFFCIIGYWKSTSLLWVTTFAAIVGCLIYIPQFLASVQTMEIVPPFAVGSAVGLRGFMSYIAGASLGTILFGVMVDRVGWDGGFYVLLTAAIGVIVFAYLTHLGAKELAREREKLATNTAPGGASISK
jgi:MFS transporter, OPA family, phosphoglycerate transporter protein